MFAAIIRAKKCSETAIIRANKCLSAENDIKSFIHKWKYRRQTDGHKYYT